MTNPQPPCPDYLIEALGLEYAIVGLYDLASIEGLHGIVEKRGCLFSCFEHWQRGESVHVCRARPGCPGSANWLCGSSAMSNENLLELLVEVEGLKPDCASMREFLAVQKPYAMRERHLVIGPLDASRTASLRTVTIFCDADQLSLLINAVFSLSPAPTQSLLLPSYGSGCLQLAAIFPSLDEPWAVISSTDVAMRVHLPRHVLSLTMTVPLFAKLCELGDESILAKHFWRRLRSSRRRSASPEPGQSS